jgi:hypothetical protein
MVKQEKRDAVRMRLLEDVYCPVDLRKELRKILPLVTARTWICNAVCVFYHNTFLIVDNKTSVVFLNEIRNMDESPPPFLHQLVISIFVPFQV